MSRLGCLVCRGHSTVAGWHCTSRDFRHCTSPVVSQPICNTVLVSIAFESSCLSCVFWEVSKGPVLLFVFEEGKLLTVALRVSHPCRVLCIYSLHPSLALCVFLACLHTPLLEHAFAESGPMLSICCALSVALSCILSREAVGIGLTV